MDNFYRKFGTVMALVLPVAMAVTIYRDFQHPEWWGDWRHNPHFYLPLILLMLIPVVLYAAHVLWGIWRLHKQIKQRAAYLDYLRKLGQK